MERAAWDPGWFDCDQSIAVGLTDEFAFWRRVPDHLRGPEELVFYQRGWDAAQDIVLATGTITALVHPELADLRAVVIGGANYRFHLADGTSFDVDQEQDPGSVCDAWTYDASGTPGPRPRPTTTTWRIVVEFDSLSGLRWVDREGLQMFLDRRPVQPRMTLAELSQRHGLPLSDAETAARQLDLSAAPTKLLTAEEVDLVRITLGLP